MTVDASNALTRSGVETLTTRPPKSPASPSGFPLLRTSALPRCRVRFPTSGCRPHRNRWWRRAAARASAFVVAPALARVLNSHRALVGLRGGSCRAPSIDPGGVTAPVCVHPIGRCGPHNSMWNTVCLCTERDEDAERSVAEGH
jgi:hypothetical protein